MSSSTLPTVLAGHETPKIEKQVRAFYGSVHEMFEAWLARRTSSHTRRAYRNDVMHFIDFYGIDWPENSWMLLQATVKDVQAWRDFQNDELDAAPLTLNRRLSSLSGLYKFMREIATEARLPINVPNPAHSQFIGREAQEAVNPTEALSANRARQLMALPSGESLIDYRDRAILKFYLYTGIRLATGCRLMVSDFLDDDEDTKVKIQEKGKGKSKRTVGINIVAADALREYLNVSGITRGPIFRARRAKNSDELSENPIDESTMYRLFKGYFEKLSGSVKDGRCIYSTHTMRATTATLLLDAGVDIADVQKLLGHKHITVTQVYDKRRKGSKESASHKLTI